MPLRSSDVGKNLESVLKRSEFKTTRINAIRRTSIARGPGGRVALQMDIPKGENKNSTFFLSPLGNPGVDAACLSLMVYLEDGFQWPLSGAGTKMGWGLWGGDDASAVSGGAYPDQQTGFSVRNVNNDYGFRLYSYHLNRSSGKHGQQGKSVARFNTSAWGTGRWHKIEMEVVLNTPGKTDGYAQVWLDGKNRQTMTNLRFRNSSKWAIRGLMFNDMWGGNTEDPKQFSPKAQKMWYADYKLYTSSKTAVASPPSTPSGGTGSSTDSPEPSNPSSGGSSFGAVSPSGTVGTGTTVLKWRPNPDANRYYVRVLTKRAKWSDRKDIYGGTVYPSKCTASMCSLSIGSLSPDQYEWMVRSQRDSTIIDPYSTLAFTVSRSSASNSSTSSPSSSGSSGEETSGGTVEQASFNSGVSYWLNLLEGLRNRSN